MCLAVQECPAPELSYGKIIWHKPDDQPSEFTLKIRKSLKLLIPL